MGNPRILNIEVFRGFDFRLKVSFLARIGDTLDLGNDHEATTTLRRRRLQNAILAADPGKATRAVRALCPRPLAAAGMPVTPAFEEVMQPVEEH